MHKRGGDFTAGAERALGLNSGSLAIAEHAQIAVGSSRKLDLGGVVLEIKALSATHSPGPLASGQRHLCG